MDKVLKFEIINNEILSIGDFDWFLDRIDAIYDGISETGSNLHTIFIQQGTETVELYFKTHIERDIRNEFNKLSDAIKQANPAFDYANSFVLVNYNNLQNVELLRYNFVRSVVLKFKNSDFRINAKIANIDDITEKLNKAKNNSRSIQ